LIADFRFYPHLKMGCKYIGLMKQSKI